MATLGSPQGVVSASAGELYIFTKIKRFIDCSLEPMEV
jgi:hypothetical protein